jgi:hypothetical protein
MLPGCREQSKVVNGQVVGPDTLSHSSFPVIPLSSRVLAESPLLARPSRIFVVDTMLVVNDGYGQPFLHILSRTTGRFLVSMGSRGEGPGQFAASPQPIGTRPGGTGDLWVFDPVLSRVTHVQPEEWVVGGAGWNSPGTVITLAPKAGLHAGWIGSDALIVTEVDPVEGYRFARYLSTGGRSATLGKLAYSDSRLPAAQIAWAYDHEMCVSPDGKLVALAYSFAGKLDLYHPDGTLASAAAVPFAFQPFVDIVPQSGKPRFAAGRPNVRAAYLGCSSGRSHLYALFSGKLNGDIRHEWFPSYSYVHVFNWDGSLNSILRLDHFPLALAVDPEESTLYTVTREEGDAGAQVRASALRLQKSAGVRP